MLNKIRNVRVIMGASCLSMLQACTTVPHPDPIDPWEGMNRDILAFNDEVDKYVLKPVAKGYQWITPEFVDTGVSNFFSNLKDIGVSVNDFLQAKPKQGAMDGARFLVNTTVGVAGFIDVATMIDLPKHEEDFAQTLAVWGVPRGPYFVMPFYGPSSVRGVGGYIGDAALHPLTYTFFFANPGVSWGAVGLRTVEIIDVRADLLEVEAIASEAAVDRYIFFRSAYMQRRDYLISDGAAQPLEFDDLDEDDLDDLDESLYLDEELEQEQEQEQEQSKP
ncbi:MAG: VacJ family lipoprotein [Thiotrichaceae bacterium]|nr:VacJ family lipoprotein [Thiotrichaceae bacterium]